MGGRLGGLHRALCSLRQLVLRIDAQVDVDDVGARPRKQHRRNGVGGHRRVARADDVGPELGDVGRRLGDQTRETPKPLLPVGGRPILDHVLANLEGCGVRDIYVSVHYHAHQISRYVETRANNADIHMVEETEPLGTAGALGRIDTDGHAPILVINGDVITDVDLVALHDFHVRDALDATIGVARYDVEVPFGVVRRGADGLFAGIDEKPRISNFVAAGVYYLSPGVAALVAKDLPLDMPELLNRSRGLGHKIGIFPIHEYWTDVGRPADLEAAAADHRNGRDAEA